MFSITNYQNSFFIYQDNTVSFMEYIDLKNEEINGFLFIADKVEIFFDVQEEHIMDFSPYNNIYQMNIFVANCIQNIIFPQKLQKLSIKPQKSCELNNLPLSLTDLFVNSFYPIKLENLPNSLEVLDIFGIVDSLDFLPVNLKKLHLQLTGPINLDNLPSGLTFLQITVFMGCNLNNFIENLPDSLEELIIGGRYNGYKIKKFPSNLKLFMINNSIIEVK